MKDRSSMSAGDLERLSAYLDGELSQKESQEMERLLVDSPDVAAAMEKLRIVKTMLKHLPVRDVPRNFTISAQDVQKFQMPAFVKGMRLASAICAALLVFVAAFDVMSPLMAAAPEMEMVRADQPALSEESAELFSDEEAPIITYHPASPKENGIGGGGGSGEGSAEPSEGILLPDAVMSLEDAQMENSSAALEEELASESASLPQAPEGKGAMEEEAVSEDARSFDENTGPILGIQPEERQGTYEKSEEIVQVEPEIQDSLLISSPSFLRISEIFLSTLSVLSFLLSVIIWKRKR